MITIPGKIPISIHPLFWLIALFIGWMWTFSLIGMILAVMVILYSVLFHEFGHALTAVAFGQKTRIELAVFGGFTYRQGRKLKLWEEFLVVLNGPIAGFILCVIAYFIAHHATIKNTYIFFMVNFTAMANFFWALINLVPILPLDGGHLMSIILEAIFGFKGVRYAIVVGLVIGSAITIFFFVISQWFIGALFLILTFESFRSLKYYRLLSERDRDTDLQDLLKGANLALEEKNIDEAIVKLERVRAQAGGGILFTMATGQLAQVYKEQMRYQLAYDILKPVRKQLTSEYFSLFHFLAYMNKDYATVAEMGNHCYQLTPTPDTAFMNALANGALGKAEPAVGWLECAIREGYETIGKAVGRTEFDPIRQDPLFKRFIAGHPSDSTEII
ncbi:MAG: site-2 protease family protein [Chlamydiia bacterium]|nr:site-2 protease family protein [Chlamydiia bacterium]